MSSNYIAKDNIPSGTVLAYSRGQIVPAEVVKEHGLDDYVVGENTKEGRELKAEITGRPVSDFETTTRTARSASSDTAATEQKG